MATPRWSTSRSPATSRRPPTASTRVWPRGPGRASGAGHQGARRRQLQPADQPGSSATTSARRAAPRPVTLVILTITFGTLVAAGLPLLIGITAVLAALGLVALPGHVQLGHEVAATELGQDPGVDLVGLAGQRRHIAHLADMGDLESASRPP